jgi:two-component system sensor histidine kinase KdpD
VGWERRDGSVKVGVEVPAPHGAALPAELGISASQDDACGLLLPLQVHGRVVGVVHVERDAGLDLTPSRQRFLRAIAYYAALGIERMHLVAQAQRAEALQAADALKDALLASVSHDLRTPLTTIKALAHRIRVEGDERAATIEEEADRLNRFVADLLDLSRLNGGATEVTLQIAALEDLLGAALQRVSGAMAHRVIDVQLAPDEPLQLATFDFTQSLRVLVNLLENADKYSPPDQPIEVRTRRVHDEWHITVADRGPGIPDVEQDRIFEPFHRAGEVPDANGAGLGLSIARRLAVLQGGRLEYAPRAQGGSCFTFVLPAATVAALPSL